MKDCVHLETLLLWYPLHKWMLAYVCRLSLRQALPGNAQADASSYLHTLLTSYIQLLLVVVLLQGDYYWLT